MRRIAVSILAPLCGVALFGAAPSSPLAGVEPGLWEVSRSARGEAPRKLCLRRMIELADVEMRGERCTRTVLGERNGSLLVDLTCARGDFARSAISVTTPRSVKLETQGIHRGQPFAYRLYARRLGACSKQMARR